MYRKFIVAETKVKIKYYEATTRVRERSVHIINLMYFILYSSYKKCDDRWWAFTLQGNVNAQFVTVVNAALLAITGVVLSEGFI